MLRLLIPSILLSLLVVAAVSNALNMEYISPEQKEQLMRDFEAAKFEKAEQILGKKWTCDMYGVRSRLQVQHDLNLYSLKPAAGGVLRNSGSQVVSEYTVTTTGLTGRSERFEDQVRLSPSGQLISRLSLRNPEAIVIAYAVCKSL